MELYDLDSRYVDNKKGGFKVDCTITNEIHVNDSTVHYLCTAIRAASSPEEFAAALYIVTCNCIGSGDNKKLIETYLTLADKWCGVITEIQYFIKEKLQR